WPQNWYEGYEGLVSLRHAVENSINVTAVKVLEDIGIEKSKTYLEKFGLINTKNPKADNYISAAENTSENDENTSAMALGSLTKGFTPVEMAGAYNAINNSGQYREPISFSKVTDSLGKVIIENPQKQNEVVSPQIAYIMRDILRTSTDYNYSKYARLDGFDIGGKTGTTTDYQDVWFVGMSPYYTISTWLGFDNQQLKMTQISQKKVVQIWSAVNKYTLEDKIPIKFDEPDGIVRVKVDTLANKLPSKYSWRDPRGIVKEEIYKAGTEPTEVSDLYESKRIDVVDGKLATDNTPPWELGWGVFIKRDPPYKPSEHNNIIPKDWKYSMPGYSDRTIFNIFKPKDKKDKNKDDEDKDDKDEKDNDKKDDDKENNRNNRDRGRKRNRDRDSSNDRNN
ncbi:MAG: penicillin-binding transpeptidase domain-containing protein, partial [Finegoldia magna]|nr:penicillin-binding transpeptidase domain-containing protein [Finegoldia magna]